MACPCGASKEEAEDWISSAEGLKQILVSKGLHSSPSRLLLIFLSFQSIEGLNPNNLFQDSDARKSYDKSKVHSDPNHVSIYSIVQHLLILLATKLSTRSICSRLIS
ncbi:unnamed protein product [Musa textilis]